MLLLPAILASRSTIGFVLGRYSPALAGLALLDLAILAGALHLLLRPGSRVWMTRVAARTPDTPVMLLLLFPLPVFFLLWFLFPFPLLERWNAFLGVCLLLLSPGVLLIGCRDGKARREALKGTMLASASLLICLLAAELAIRMAVPGSFFNPRLGLIPYARRTIMVDIPGTSMGGTLSTNRWGLRGEEPPEDWDAWTTIVTVGGSTTADYYLDDAKTWSHVLQETLRREDSLVWVGNGGIPQHNAETHDYFLREVVAEIRPDIVLFLVGINDIGEFLKGPIVSDPPLPESGPRAFLFAGSRLLQTLYKAKKVYIEGAQVISENVDPEFELLPMPGPEAPLPEDPGGLLQNPGYYEQRILRLIETCRTLNVTPIFMTQPLLYDDTENWRGIQGGSFRYIGPDSIFSAASRWRMLDWLNRQLIDVCEREGVACFDLASRIPHDMSMFYDDMHFTETGSGRIGRLAGKFILSRRMLHGT
jgi:lysophospholipase L1-like esterase